MLLSARSVTYNLWCFSKQLGTPNPFYQGPHFTFLSCHESCHGLSSNGLRLNIHPGLLRSISVSPESKKAAGTKKKTPISAQPGSHIELSFRECESRRRTSCEIAARYSYMSKPVLVLRELPGCSYVEPVRQVQVVPRCGFGSINLLFRRNLRWLFNLLQCSGCGTILFVALRHVTQLATEYILFSPVKASFIPPLSTEVQQYSIS